MLRPAALLLCVAFSSAAFARDSIGLAVPNDDVDRGVYREVESKLRDRGDVVNLSLAYRELHDPSPLSIGKLETPAPGWLPKPLAADWAAGVENCKTRSPQPWGPDNKEARICGGRLGEALWQRFVEEQKFSYVVTVLMEPVDANNSGDDRQRLRVVSFIPGEPSQHSAERREVEYVEVKEVASVLALRVATGGGSIEPRVILRTLPAPKPKEEEPIPSLPALPIPSDCHEPLPESLSIEPADARLSQILVLHWKNTTATAPSKTAPVACNLDTDAKPQKLMGQTVLLGSSTLTCGRKLKVIGKLHKTTQALLDVAMSEELVKRLLGLYCGGAAAP